MAIDVHAESRYYNDDPYKAASISDEGSTVDVATRFGSEFGDIQLLRTARISFCGDERRTTRGNHPRRWRQSP